MTSTGIALVTFGYTEYAHEAVRSLVEQTHSDWRCVVVFDPHESQEDIPALVTSDSRFGLLAACRTFPSKARNIAFEGLDCTYCISLDADDVLRPRYIEIVESLLSSDPAARIAYTATEYFGDHNGIAERVQYTPRLLGIRNMIVSSAMFRKADFLRVGGYDDKLEQGFEDWEFWIAILKGGGHVAFSSRPEFLYRQHSRSRSRLMTENARRVCKEYIFNKHRDFCWAS
jgi:Glycosyl transferase family 2